MSGIRVTISEEFADDLLELFRNALESGCDFGESTLEDYDSFYRSVTCAKRRKKLMRFNERMNDVKQFLEEHANI